MNCFLAKSCTAGYYVSKYCFANNLVISCLIIAIVVLLAVGLIKAICAFLSYMKVSYIPTVKVSMKTNESEKCKEWGDVQYSLASLKDTYLKYEVSIKRKRFFWMLPCKNVPFYLDFDFEQDNKEAGIIDYTGIKNETKEPKQGKYEFSAVASRKSKPTVVIFRLPDTWDSNNKFIITLKFGRFLKRFNRTVFISRKQ